LKNDQVWFKTLANKKPYDVTKHGIPIIMRKDIVIFYDPHCCKKCVPNFPKPSLYSWRCLGSPPNFENNPKMNECKTLAKLSAYSSNSFKVAHEWLKTSLFSYFALVG
jgi:hypothetical protein